MNATDQLICAQLMAAIPALQQVNKAGMHHKMLQHHSLHGRAPCKQSSHAQCLLPLRSSHAHSSGPAAAAAELVSHAWLRSDRASLATPAAAAGVSDVFVLDFDGVVIDSEPEVRSSLELMRVHAPHAAAAWSHMPHTCLCFTSATLPRLCTHPAHDTRGGHASPSRTKAVRPCAARAWLMADAGHAMLLVGHSSPPPPASSTRTCARSPGGR
jgi:hypothetical protein